MKKHLILAMVSLMAISALTGCNKKKEKEPVAEKEVIEVQETKKEEKKEEPAKEAVFEVGAYACEREEEFADGIEVFTDYLYFDKDGKGIAVIQDDIPFTWTEGKISSEDGMNYSFKLVSEGVIEVDFDGFVSEYKYIGDTLPEDVLDEMRHNLDGTKKVNNDEAGFALEDLITSDVIEFYSPTSAKQYSAEGEELNDMKAAYIEMTEDYIPVLLVKTPDAPKEVGIEHILQYADGKIYDIAGVDTVNAIYKNSVVIISSLSDASGDNTYFHKLDSDNILYLFALKTENNGETSYQLFEESAAGEEASEDEFNSCVEAAIAGDEAVEQIEWKELEKVF